MSNFVLVDSNYDRVPQLICEVVNGFTNSPEYALLAESEREVPGLVCAALTRFLVRFQVEALLGPLSSADSMTLDDCYEAIEMLIALQDARIRTLVEDEIFENIQGDDELWRAIRSQLGTSARELLAKWEEKQSSRRVHEE